MDLAEQIKQKVPIEEYIQYSHKLEKRGYQYVMRCPWHNDTKPSLVIRPKKRRWDCFVCGIGGSVIDWVMQYENKTLGEALVVLAKHAGLSLTDRSIKPIEGSTRPKLNYWDLNPVERAFVDYTSSESLTKDFILKTLDLAKLGKIKNEAILLLILPRLIVINSPIYNELIFNEIVKLTDYNKKDLDEKLFSHSQKYKIRKELL